MKGRMFFSVLIIVVVLGLVNYSQSADNLYHDRIYEPVILRGDILAQFYDIPINEIFIFAYHDSTKTWTMIPFQIDEMAYGEDPFSPGAFQDFYFIQDDGLLDEKDELVFMIRDLGDEAPQTSWIDNEPAKNFQRLEVMVYDPNDSQHRAFGYLFRSSTITDEIPSPYGFSFDPMNHVVSSNFYSVRLSQSNGLIEDVIIYPPFGSGVDILIRKSFDLSVCLTWGSLPSASVKMGVQQPMNGITFIFIMKMMWIIIICGTHQSQSSG